MKKHAAREHAHQLNEQRKRRQRRSHIIRVCSIAGSALLAVLIATLIISTALREPSSSAANSESSGDTSLIGRPAPAFTLSDTLGSSVSLASYRGKSALILYFSEGAGCEACILQLKSIEQKTKVFAEAGFTVLPIVMNTKDQIAAEATSYDVKTPFLLDNGTASKAYDTLGHGMHEGMPGHSFVVIDKTGIVRWSGEYPSMWLDASELLKKAKSAVR